MPSHLRGEVEREQPVPVPIAKIVREGQALVDGARQHVEGLEHVGIELVDGEHMTCQVRLRAGLRLVPDPVIAVDVGLHRDPVGARIGGQGERMVLGHAQSRIEPVADGAGEFGAIHLEDVERVDEGRSARVRLTERLAEHHLGHPAVDTDVLADDDVGSPLPAEPGHRLDRLRAEEVVDVDEVRPLPLGLIEDRIAGFGGGARIGPPHHAAAEAKVLEETVGELSGAVGGSVVDDDGLDAPEVGSLVRDALQARREILLRVVSGDADRDVGSA
ncbi:Uncharacterised protein [Mycobacteroides abscessus subsp. abscessus]|nr:Uncharacterised protein [Mycobacteroides abscessus subsp. abscessus]